ncbi:MAG: rane protein [Devosia sp.]|nr:rane protein [Devosia sp.]
MFTALTPVDIALYVTALLATGVVAGFIAGLLGVGGGIVIVPVLYYVFTALGVPEDVKMHIAVGTSLSTIIFTSAMSVRAHNSRGAVDWALLRRWTPGIVVGVIIGTQLAAFISGEMLTAIFGFVALIVAIYMIVSRPEWRLANQLPGTWAQRAMAAVIGLISSLMGIGGGTLSVPAMTLVGYPIHKAVGTASAIGFAIGVPGTIGMIIGGWGKPDLPPLSLGFVSLIGLILILPTSMLLAPVGARAAHALPVRALKFAFAVFLALTAIRMLYSVFFGT